MVMKIVLWGLVVALGLMWLTRRNARKGSQGNR
jgi:hypothetical protein